LEVFFHYPEVKGATRLTALAAKIDKMVNNEVKGKEEFLKFPSAFDEDAQQEFVAKIAENNEKDQEDETKEDETKEEVLDEKLDSKNTEDKLQPKTVKNEVIIDPLSSLNKIPKSKPKPKPVTEEDTRGFFPVKRIRGNSESEESVENLDGDHSPVEEVKQKQEDK
jgi:hypothetical protein